MRHLGWFGRSLRRGSDARARKAVRRSFSAPTEALESRVLLTAFIVNSTADTFDTSDNQVTLRDAVYAANNNVAAELNGAAGTADGDSITFADGLGPITLGSEILISDDVTIDGGGDITIQGGSANRIFNIAAAGGAGSSQAVLLQTITLTGGNVTGDGGAVLIADGEDVTFNGVVVTQSTATGDGGAVYAGNGSLNVGNSSFFNNTANNGGAIYSTGTLTASGTVFGTVNPGQDPFDPSDDVSFGNTATTSGGAIFNTGTLLLTGGTIEANAAGGAAATDGGGGIYNDDGGDATVNGFALITGNSATGALGSGGGIFSRGTLTVSQGTQIESNTAVRAGGGIEIGAATAGTNTTTLQNATFFSNSATGVADPVSGTVDPTIGNGGGVHLTGNGTVNVVAGTTFDSNTAIEGGAIWISASGTLHVQTGLDPFGTDTVGATFSANTATGNANPANSSTTDLQGGGAIFNLGGTITIDGASIVGNNATGTGFGSGGGLLSITGAVTITNTAFEGNGSVRAGGGIEVVTGTIGLTDSTLSGNTVGQTAGFIAGNGGGLHITGGANVTVTRGSVAGNRAGSAGGGLWNSGTGTLIIDTVTIDQNVARRGGGLYNNTDGTGTGGGNLTVTASTISRNRASSSANGGGGGGLEVVNGANVSIVNSTFSANTTAGAGGNLLIDAGTVSLDSVTITLGNASGAGGGVAVAGGTLTSTNTIIAGNTAGTAGPDVSGTLTSGGYNLIGSTAGALIVGVTTGNLLNVDPRLGALQNNGGPTLTHALLVRSPAIDAGSTVQTTDQRGATRPQGPASDIGAFEAPPTVPATSPAAFVIGTGDGQVLLLDASGNVTSSFRPYAGFFGDIHVALADLNGDNRLDIITGAGQGGGPRVTVFDGNDLTFKTILADFFAYETTFTGGVYVSGGFVDGVNALVTGAGEGGGPRVRAFDVSDPTGKTVVADFFAFESGFRGGVRVAVGDFNGDRIDDVAAAAGPGGGPRVKVYNGKNLFTQTVIADFFAYDPGFTGGVFVSVGKAAGRQVLVTGAGANGGPDVHVYGAGTTTVPVLLSSFFAYDTGFRGGVTVGLLDVNGDGNDEIITAPGRGGGPEVKAHNGDILGDEGQNDLIADFFAGDSTLRDGIFAPV